MVDGSKDERSEKDRISEDLHVHPWLSVFGSMFPSDFGMLAVLAVFVTILWFVLLYLVSVPLELNTEYLDPTGVLGSAAYFFAFMLGIELVVIAYWITNCESRWKQVETCFVERERFRRKVRRHSRWYKPTRMIPMILAAYIVYNLSVTIHVQQLDPLNNTLHVLLFMINTSLVLATAVIIYFLIVHLHLIRSVLRLKLQNTYSAARKFDPLIRFSTQVATGWFAFVTLYLIYLYYLVATQGFGSDTDGTFPVSVLDIALELIQNPPNVPFYPDPSGYLLAILLFMLVGFLIFLAPIWMVHMRLKAAKRTLLFEIEGRYDDVIIGQDGAPEWDPEVISELDRIDRVRDSTTRIRMWPSDVESVAELLVASAIPVFQMILLPIIQNILSNVY